MAVTWTLKDAAGADLTHQPSAGSPLALKFSNSGDPHLSGYATELIDTIVCETTSAPVVIDLTPDTSGYALDETSSTPTRNPGTHGGSLTWTDVSGQTTLSFTVPAAPGDTWGWDFGLGEPSVALKLKVKIKRVT